eukprot:2832174-Ditylum_brightwellii.AAC.2
MAPLMTTKWHWHYLAQNVCHMKNPVITKCGLPMALAVGTWAQYYTTVGATVYSLKILEPNASQALCSKTCSLQPYLCNQGVSTKYTIP